MAPRGTVIAAQVAHWGGAPLVLEPALFGTADPDELAAVIDRWCRAELGEGIAAYRFFASSSGSVHGVELDDGGCVVVKGHRPEVRAPMEVPADALYPRPHSPRFDFAATASGAEWIDEYARRALAPLPARHHHHPRSRARRTGSRRPYSH